MSVIDVTTAVILIVILLAGAIITNRIIQSRRNRIQKREDIYDNIPRRATQSPSTMPVLRSLQKNKLKILAAIITFIIIIVILSESVVIVQAGHRGVVLYVGAVENSYN